MKADLVIGMATGYSWEDLQPWVISLRRSGYTGLAMLIVGEAAGEPVGYCPGFAPEDYATPEEAKIRKARNLIDTPEKLAKKLLEYNVTTFNPGRMENHPSIERGMIIADILDTAGDGLRYVIITDTKDVVFQSDPRIWLEQNLVGNEKIAIQSEGKSYRQSPGNRLNVADAYGLEKAKEVVDWEVLNAGVIAGHVDAVRDFCRDIYGMSLLDERLNFFKPTYEEMLADQSALNILAREERWCALVKIVPATSGFVSEFHHKVHREVRDGVMYNPQEPYCMWHQWTANGDWWRAVKEKYRDAASYEEGHL